MTAATVRLVIPPAAKDSAASLKCQFQVLHVQTFIQHLGGELEGERAAEVTAVQLILRGGLSAEPKGLGGQ